ncbi:MAG: esterase-like activity of phytase family protein, partial [Rhodospirillales bacterium]
IESYPPAPDGPGRPAGTAMVPPGADGLPANSGLETVTVLSDGRLLALAEGPDNGRPERDGWIGGPDGWARFTYLAAPGYRPTDATVLPGGDVLVLERYFSLFGGLAGRVVRVPAAALAEGARVSGTLLRELTPPLPVSNYEGIATVRTADGETLVFVLGDDNFSNAITTYLIVFALRP